MVRNYWAVFINLLGIILDSTTTAPTTTLPGEPGKGGNLDGRTLFSCFSPLGESPPGQAAQIGMGIGITAIAVLAIVETVILARKYGSTALGRQSNYQLPLGPQYELA